MRISTGLSSEYLEEKLGVVWLGRTLWGLVGDGGAGDLLFGVFLQWTKGPLTLFLLLLFFLLQLALFNTAQLGLADAPSLADGLQQSGPATGGVNHFLGSSLDWNWEVGWA